jgi:putative ABC transport system substrate-binding protein
LLPDAAVVAMLVNPANPIVEPESRATQDAARSLGVQLHILRASTAGEIDAAFASLVKLRARALVVGDDSYFINQRAQIIALAALHAIPTIPNGASSPPPAVARSCTEGVGAALILFAGMLADTN